MTATITDLAEKRLEKQPHVSGECFCVSCQHVWVEVRPWTADGIQWTECPSCRRETGRYFRAFQWEQKLSLTCDCGNHLFIIYEGGRIFCPACASVREVSEL